MGRSVSFPVNCAVVCFRDISNFGRQVDDQGEYTDEFCPNQAYDDWLWFMDDVRGYLRDMGDQDGEVFERVLEIPDELVDQIAEEYGCLL